MRTETLSQDEFPEGWKTKVFSEAIVVNPKRELKKGTESKFVSMADIKGFDKKIQRHTTKKFSGGSKFINGDTLMARITPCLENGKTAFVDILDKGEVASGSTEFIVLSAKEGKTVPQFVYYTAISPQIRTTAIKSMTGTSGRQRVENVIFDKITISIPPIEEQEAMANILKSLDDKIALNRAMNATLEAIGQALFKHWFVDFEFPNKEGKPYKSSGGEMVNSELGEVPKGWDVVPLPEVTQIVDCLHTKKSNQEKIGSVLLQVYNIGENGVLNLDEVYRVSDADYAAWTKNILVKVGDCVITNAGKVGAIAQIPFGYTFGIGRNMTAIRPLKIPPTYLLEFLLSEYGQAEIVKNTDYGTIFNSLNVKGIRKINVLLPPEAILARYEQVTRCLRHRIENNNSENDFLSKIRDALLPKLMSGEIRVN